MLYWTSGRSETGNPEIMKTRGGLGMKDRGKAGKGIMKATRSTNENRMKIGTLRGLNAIQKWTRAGNLDDSLQWGRQGGNPMRVQVERKLQLLF